MGEIFAIICRTTHWLGSWKSPCELFCTFSNMHVTYHLGQILANHLDFNGFENFGNVQVQLLRRNFGFCIIE